MSFAVRPIGLVKTGFVWRPTISSDATNWVLKTQAIAAGWDGVTPLDAEVTVGSGIVLSLATLFPDDGIDLSQVTGQRAMPTPLGEPRKTERPA